MGSYRVEISNMARREIRILPGYARSLIFHALQSLEKDTRPHSSREMKTTKGLILPQGMELRRIRINRWRIVYVVEADLSLVTVLAIRKRPPYQYEDLEELLHEA